MKFPVQILFIGGEKNITVVLKTVSDRGVFVQHEQESEQMSMLEYSSMDNQAHINNSALQ